MSLHEEGGRIPLEADECSKINVAVSNQLVELLREDEEHHDPLADVNSSLMLILAVRKWLSCDTFFDGF